MRRARTVIVDAVLLAVTCVGLTGVAEGAFGNGTLTGHVVAQDSGRALAGVLVTVYSDQRGEARSATTDSGGGFTVDALAPGRYFVDFTSARGSRYASEAMFVQGGTNRGEGVEVRISAGETSILEHRLVVGAEIELRFEDANGAEWDPTDGKEPHILIVQSFADGAQRRLTPTAMEREGGAGRLVFRGLPRATSVAVLVHVAGYAGLHCPAGELTPGERVPVVARVDRENPTGVEGFVSPASSVELVSEPGGHLLSEARADAHGHFAISGLRPALYGLRVNGRREGLIRVAPGEKTHVDLRPQPGGSPWHLPTLPPQGGDMDEVELELVVRDRGGHAVHDLKPAEVEVYENGVAQQLTRLDHVDRPTAHVSIVVDQISAANWAAAMQASADLVDRMTTGSSVAAFRVDGGVTPIVPVTTSKDAARAAFAGARPTLTAHEEVHDPLTTDAVRALRAFGSQAREHRTLYSLLAIVGAHAGISGRKVVVFMCEGLPLSTDNEGVFHSVIAAANRVGVSIYPIDLRGMDADQQLAVAEAALDAEEGVWTFVDQDDEETEPGPEQIVSAATHQAVMDWTSLSAPRTDERAVLEELAAGTGGFVIANSDYLERGLKWIAEDLQRYDELAYVPKDRRYDDGYRRIEVRILRGGVRAQYRDGYPAVPPSLDGPLLTYEVPLLRELDRAQQDFPVSIAIYSFRQEGQDVRVAWSTQIPLSQMTFVPQADATLRGELALLTLVRDVQGEVVFKRSYDLPLSRARDALEAMAGQTIQLVEHAGLAPGAYTIEMAVRDVEGERVALHRESVVVPAPDRQPGLGSVVVAAGFMTPTVSDPMDPFQTSSFRVMPANDGVLTPSPGARTVPVYLVVDPLPDVPSPRLTLELRRAGHRVTSDTLDLPQPDDQGSIRYISGVPLEGLPAGDYEIHALVAQGGRVAERTAPLHLRASQPADTEALRIADGRPAPTPSTSTRTGHVLLDVAEEKVALGQVGPAAPQPPDSRRKSRKKIVAIATGALGLGAGAVALASRGEGETTTSSPLSITPPNGIASATEFHLDAASVACGTACSWDFGDGTTATGRSAVHVFLERGDYTVRLMDGSRALASAQVAVESLSGEWREAVYSDVYFIQQTGSSLAASTGRYAEGRMCDWRGSINPPGRFSLQGTCWIFTTGRSGNSTPDPGRPSEVTGAVLDGRSLRINVDGVDYSLRR